MRNNLVRNILAATFGILILAVLSIYQNVLQATARATVIDVVDISSRDGTIIAKAALPLMARDILEAGDLETYVITLKSPSQDSAQYFYFPQMDENINLSAGAGVELSNLQSVMISDPFRPRSIAFQASQGIEHRINSVSLLISRANLSPTVGQHVLSKIYISPSSDLLQAIQSRLLIEDLMRPLMLGIQIILIVYMGVIGAILSLPILRWFTLFFVTATLLTSGYLVSLFGIPIEAFRFSFLVFSGLAGLSLIGAAKALRGLRWGKKFVALFVFVLVSNAVMALTDTFPPFTQYIMLNGPISILGLFYFLAVLIRQPFASYKPEKNLLLASIGILFAGWGHDVLVQGGMIGAGILIGNFTRMGVAFSALGYVIILQIENHHAAQDLLVSQGVQLDEKDLIIQRQHARELESARVLAMHEERQNLNRELHDGVSSNLVSVIAMLKKQNASQDVISLAQLTIRELRSVISAASVSDADVGFFISLFRENYLRYYDLDEAQVTFSLDSDALDLKINARNGMQFLRILQEAFANIVKHAPLANVCFTLERLSCEAVSVSVSNSIDATVCTEAVAGLGLINMQTRADRAGCRLCVSQSDKDFTITLEIPA